MVLDNPEVKEETGVVSQETAKRSIILFNDEVNTFDFVIDCLIDVCEHELEQAEQCTLLVHYKGKCDVKNGEMTELKPICEELLRRGLTAEIH